jgi:hypothetical protein
MLQSASQLAYRLARNAEAVCRYYLSNGRRQGRYWLVGDVFNTPGRSLFVRLRGLDSGKGAAGKWTDAATGEHGDLLDLIAKTRSLYRLCDVLDEARAFLSLPPQAPNSSASQDQATASHGSSESARRLYAMSQPIQRTLAEAYLAGRSITAIPSGGPLRFHPCCYYRPDANSPTETWPAMIAAVTDLAGKITGVHRSWLDPSSSGKAPIATPRRAMGHLIGHGVRFGAVADVLAAGEGIETMLSLRSIASALPVQAALSANHLSAILFPTTLRRLYIARDNDPPGEAAASRLRLRAEAEGIEVLILSPTLKDFNEDLCRIGADDLQHGVRLQLVPEDAARFLGEHRP